MRSEWAEDAGGRGVEGFGVLGFWVGNLRFRNWDLALRD